MPKIKGAENLATIQRKILEERGLEKVKSDPTKKKQHSRLLTISVSSRDHLKTPTMRLLEIKFGEPIEFMLLRGSLSAVARKLAMIDKSTASKWIKKLNLRQQLPCDMCKMARTSCLDGHCWRFKRDRLMPDEYSQS